MCRALLLDEAVPLLTLTGPGGVGKTRLALAIAEDVRDAFAEGMLFVDLSSLADPDLVATTVAARLGLGSPGDGSATDALVTHLRAKQFLLVVDNCEHVLLAAAHLVSTLLAECPALQVLVTSRAPLRVRGEHVHVIPPLALPPPGATDLAEIQRSEAVIFFADRARAAESSFRLTHANAAAVAGICHHLDGLPLAIELAAARARVLSPHALHGLLDQHVPALGSGAEDSPARHRSLHHAIDWSYALLAPDAQRFFRSLAVFSGGWSLQGVAAMHNLPVPEALDHLETLVNQSLVVQQPHVDEASPRFTMLETIRAFALEQLAEHGERTQFRAAHATWIGDLGRRAQPELFSARALPWLRLLDVEIDNIRAAIEWWLQAGAPESVLQFLADTDEYWSARRYRTEVRRWVEAALLAAPDAPPLLRSAARHIAVFATRSLGDFSSALSHAAAGLAAAQESEDLIAIGRAYYQLGNAWHHIDPDRAVEATTNAVATFRLAGHRMWLAGALCDLGDKLNSVGDVQRAAETLDEGLALQRAHNYAWGIAEALGQRAHVARAQGDLAGAARWFVESIPVAREIGDEHKIMGAVAGLAGVALDLGQPRRAAHLLGAVAAEQAATGWPRVAHQFHVDAITASVRDTLGDDAFAAAVAAGRQMPFAVALADALSLVQPGGLSAAPPSVSGDPARVRPGHTHGTATCHAAAHHPLSCLTPRERDVLRLLCQRQTNAEMATELFLSPRTIETHVARVLAKLGAPNRREAAAIAVRSGIV